MKYFNDFDLRSYIRVYSNINHSLCDSIFYSSKTFSWEKHCYSDPLGNVVQFQDELDISSDVDFLNRDELVNIIWNTILQYKQDLNFPWFQKWEGFSPIRFNKYLPGTLMRRHFDNIKSMFDGERKGNPVLSIVGSINDNYEGGEFVFFDDLEFKLMKGDIVVFPSTFLYPHQVKPVTKGERITFVSWTY